MEEDLEYDPFDDDKSVFPEDLADDFSSAGSDEFNPDDASGSNECGGGVSPSS